MIQLCWFPETSPARLPAPARVWKSEDASEARSVNGATLMEFKCNRSSTSFLIHLRAAGIVPASGYIWYWCALEYLFDYYKNAKLRTFFPRWRELSLIRNPPEPASSHFPHTTDPSKPSSLISFNCQSRSDDKSSPQYFLSLVIFTMLNISSKKKKKKPDLNVVLKRNLLFVTLWVLKVLRERMT